MYITFTTVFQFQSRNTEVFDSQKRMKKILPPDVSHWVQKDNQWGLSISCSPLDCILDERHIIITMVEFFRLFGVTEVASNSSLLLVEIFCLFAQILAFVAQITFTSCTICVLPSCFFLLASMICTSPILHFISAWLFNVSSPAFHCLSSILLTCYCFLVSVHILAAKTPLKDWMFRGIQNLFQAVFYI